MIDEIFEYDIDTDRESFERYCQECDFVFNLAGINRPQNVEEFNINHSFLAELLNTLKKYENRCPVMLSSSTQALLDNDYGKSKKEAEDLLLKYGKENDIRVLVYRFPNVFGKWCRPNYNSGVATFCNNIANDLPITVNDPSVELEMLFIDDLIEEMYDAMEGHPHRAEYPAIGEVVDNVEYDGLTPRASETGRYCYTPVTHKAMLG